MKINRAQIRALELKTKGFVDDMECELSDDTPNDDVVLQFHHVRVVAATDGRWFVVNRDTERPISEGHLPTREVNA